MFNPISFLNSNLNFFSFISSKLKNFARDWPSNLKEIKYLLLLAIPVLSANIFGALMEMCDAFMAGRSSAFDLKVVAKISAFWFPILFLLQNILLNTLPLIVRFREARHHEKIREMFWNGLTLALGISAIAILILSHMPYLFATIFAGNEPDRLVTSALMIRYCKILMWGCPAFFLFSICKSFTDGAGKTIIGTKIGFCGLCSNVLFNYLFIYGSYGFPKLGALGCAVSTVLSYWVMTILFAINFAYSAHLYKKILGTEIFRMQRPKLSILLQQFSYGSIYGLVHFIETIAFSACTFLLDIWSEHAAIEIPSIRITIVISDFLYLLPLSIGIATTIRIGALLGKNSQKKELRRCKNVSLALGLVIALFNCIVLICLRSHVASCFSGCQTIQNLSQVLLTYAAVYQLPEAVQVICFSILRAYQELFTLLFLNIFSYWLIAVPVGAILGLTSWYTSAPLGAVGFWIGLVAGLTCAAACGFMRVVYLFSNKDEALQKTA